MQYVLCLSNESSSVICHLIPSPTLPSYTVSMYIGEGLLYAAETPQWPKAYFSPPLFLF